MLSCREICKSLSNFEGEQTFTLENHNILFEQAIDFSKKYLELVEDKIKENGWIDPNLNPEKFKQFKKENKDYDATIVFSTPIYKVWIGNFKSRIEAERNLNLIKKKYPNAIIIKPNK